MPSNNKAMSHMFIPDTQIQPGSKLEHIYAAANYISDKRPHRIILIGDWWDMKGLNSYDKPGKKGWEDHDVAADFAAGCDAMSDFIRIIKVKGYTPDIHFCMGNHENRVLRAREDPNNRKFKGFLTDKQFCLDKYALPIKVHPFLKIVTIDGILYSHYFVNPDSLMANAIGGGIENKLRKLGHSFSMGHQQTKQTGSVYTATGERRVGLVCGRFYQDEQVYLGPQKNRQSWSGIFMKHEVRKGDYDLMEVSMKYLFGELAMNDNTKVLLDRIDELEKSEIEMEQVHEADWLEAHQKIVELETQLEEVVNEHNILKSISAKLREEVEHLKDDLAVTSKTCDMQKKQIADLEEQNEHLRDCNDVLYSANEKLEERITERTARGT